MVQEFAIGFQEGYSAQQQQKLRDECPVFASLESWEPVEWDSRGITLPWCERFGCEQLCRFRRGALERLSDMPDSVIRVNVIGSNRDAAGNDLDDV